MKIVWIIGTELSTNDISNNKNQLKNSGGWNNTQLKYLYETNLVRELIIISVRPTKYKEKIEKKGKMTIYHLEYKPITTHINMKLIDEIYQILIKCKPDIIDIQGSETTYGAIAFLKKMPCPFLITIHGVAYQCERFYVRGFPEHTLVTNRTLYDWISFRGIYEKNILMKKRAKIEEKIINSTKYVRGRTEWDKACILFKNQKIKYYNEELILRKEFKNAHWDISKCDKHRIFATQANSPLKSIYTIIETISILKGKYPDIKLVIPGHILKKGILKNGYEKLLYKRIKKFGIEENIIFTGNLDAEGMVSELLKARVFLLQSEIENSPNSLAEAQMVGVPCIASFTGGTPEYIKNGETGFLYNSYDPIMAAMYIQKLFEDDNLCIKLSKAETIVAKNRHCEENITNNLITIYKDIIVNEYNIKNNKEVSN